MVITANKTVNLKQMKKTILRLKNSMVKNLSTITNTASKMISNVNSVLTSLADEDYLRNISIGIAMDKLNMPENFFDTGENYAETFAGGFLSGISPYGTGFAASAGDITKSGNVTYNSNYNFYSSGLTVSQQLQQARHEDMINGLRT